MLNVSIVLIKSKVPFLSQVVHQTDLKINYLLILICYRERGTEDFNPNVFPLLSVTITALLYEFVKKELLYWTLYIHDFPDQLDKPFSTEWSLSDVERYIRTKAMDFFAARTFLSQPSLSSHYVSYMNSVCLNEILMLYEWICKGTGVKYLQTNLYLKHFIDPLAGNGIYSRKSLKLSIKL